ncbi:hypothetical protein D6783_00305 [Candidatus Woesearchaeota archaeon]|nr:MAG: hypothetical protein D6783_00305 [Candidatus Woesearchaeota archaeon]
MEDARSDLEHKHYVLGMVLIVGIVAVFALGASTVRPAGSFAEWDRPFSSPEMMDTGSYAVRGGFPSVGMAYGGLGGAGGGSYGVLDGGASSGSLGQSPVPLPQPYLPGNPSPGPIVAPGAHPGGTSADTLVARGGVLHVRECASPKAFCVGLGESLVFFDGTAHHVLKYERFGRVNGRTQAVFRDEISGVSKYVLVQDNAGLLKLGGKVFTVFVESEDVASPRLSVDLNGDHLVNGFVVPPVQF